MNLYLIGRPTSAGYDEYDSAVVAAKSPQDAKMIHCRDAGFTPEQCWFFTCNAGN